MAFKLNRSSKEPMSEINVTPFVDVMLVLLIVFMITAPLMKTGVEIELPKVNTPNIPESDETTIVHGDYRLGNLIYDLNEPKVLAVLDWELSTLGHPLADLGYNLMLHEEDSDVRSGFSLKNLDLVKLGIPTKDYLVEKYCEMVIDQRTGRYKFHNVEKKNLHHFQVQTLTTIL